MVNAHAAAEFSNPIQFWSLYNFHFILICRAVILKRVGGLKAYTQYAFRVEAIVIAGTGVKSSITYYKTKQTSMCNILLICFSCFYDTFAHV
jgi:hypothetical protein